MSWWLAIFKKFSDESAWGSREHATDHDDAKAKAKERYEEALDGLTESVPEGSEDNGDYYCIVVAEGSARTQG